MLLNLPPFVAVERPYWDELERVLNRLEQDPTRQLSLSEIQRFHYLYQRASADLARLATFAAAPELQRHVESLVARAYGEVHETRERRRVPSLWRGLTVTFPQTVRRHGRALALSVALTLLGSAFGAGALAIDAEAKSVLMPFSHLQKSPRERVADEEAERGARVSGAQGRFSAELMTHNTRVALLTLALGMTWGVGTVSVLFYNGVILGAVAYDYVVDGQLRFLLGWLLPHGAVEIPAILLGGQAGLVLAHALIGWGERTTRRERLRAVSQDLAVLAGGAAVLLVWAGLVESFLSQYHEPVLPYELKIAFGTLELAALTVFLWRAGRRTTTP